MTVTARRSAGLTIVGALVAVLGLAFVSSYWTSNEATAQKKTKKKAADEVRYSHEVHTKVGVKHDRCETCHVLDENYTVLAPTLGKNHLPCAEAECHATEYFSKKPTICVVCHSDVKPWVKQPAELKKRATSEFGGDLSHKTHATARVGGSGANGACKKCHGNVFKGTPARGGHDDCAPCHAKNSKPSMGDCGGCHELGARKARSQAKISEWSVKTTFTHDTHGRDPRGGKSETECTTCHQSIPGAEKLADIENPTMRSCDTCHDGKSAFKTTGFECYRCHSSGKPSAKTSAKTSVKTLAPRAQIANRKADTRVTAP